MAETTTTRYDCTKPFVFLNNRRYDPSTGVFLSVDPLVQMTFEPYVYGSANPITNSDPSGLCGCEDFSLPNSYTPGTSAGDAVNEQRNRWWQPTQHRPAPSGIGYGIGRFLAGVSDTPGRMARETAGLVTTNPWTTAKALGGAAWHWQGTLSAMWDGCTGTAQGAGECVGDVIIAVLIGKASTKWLSGSSRLVGIDSLGEKFVRALGDIDNGVARPNVRNARRFANDGRGKIAQLPGPTESTR